MVSSKRKTLGTYRTFVLFKRYEILTIITNRFAKTLIMLFNWYKVIYKKNINFLFKHIF